ncbi:MAG: AAA family ATPase [Alphaproteobacteria bacterium]|nr:AAA family ATPase [Alphaproteobacteria bacterium]
MSALARRAPTPQRVNPAPIVAVASGKGGVGKTWFSTTLACTYGRQNRRTLLVDGDLGLANVDVQLGIRPKSDLAAVVNGWIDLEAAVTPVLGGPSKTGGFDLLPGHSGSGRLANVTMEDVAGIVAGLATLAFHYDRVILDLAAGVDAQTIRLAGAADKVVVVTTEEPTALTDAYAFIKVLRLHNPLLTPSIVVNMADKRLTGRKIYDQLAKACEAYLGVRPPLAGVIVRDTAVPECIRAQTPLPIRSPGAPALDDVIRIADQIAIDPA